MRITEAFERITKGTETGDLLNAEVSSVFETYGDLIFAEISQIWNWIFEFGAARSDRPEIKYEPVTTEWLADNVTIANLSDLVRELADRNRMGWLIPFFKSQIATRIRSAIIPGNGKAAAKLAS